MPSETEKSPLDQGGLFKKSQHNDSGEVENENYKDNDHHTLLNATTTTFTEHDNSVSRDSDEVESVEPSETRSYSAIYFYSIVVLLLLINVMNQLDRWLIAFIAPQIQNDLNISKIQYGLAAGYGFSLVYIGVGIPAGLLSDRLYPKYILIFSLAMWSLLTMLTPLCKSYTQFLLIRIGTGMSESMCNPAAFAILNQSNFSKGDLTIANSVYNSAVYIGVGLAASFGRGLTDLIGWKDSFFLFGAVGLLVGTVSLCFLPNITASNPRTKTSFSLRSINLFSLLKSMFLYPPRWLLPLAGGFRSIGGYTFGFYMYGYLDIVYNLDNSRPYFPWVYGLVTSIGGLSSVFIGAWITNKSRKKVGERGALYTSSLLNLIAIFWVFALIYFQTIKFFHSTTTNNSNDITNYDHNLYSDDNTVQSVVMIDSQSDLNFSLMVSFLFLAFVFAECWGGPCAALYGRIIPKESSGVSFAMYIFVLTILGAGGPEILALFPSSKVKDPQGLTRTLYSHHFLFAIVGLSYFFAAALWLAASRYISSSPSSASILLSSSKTNVSMRETISESVSSDIDNDIMDDEQSRLLNDNTSKDQEDRPLSSSQRLISILYIIGLIAFWATISGISITKIVQHTEKT